MSQGQPKTQILITDIPKEKFTQKWPKTIETLLFETKFPELRSKLQYFTPLPFLQRIVIIFDDSTSALKTYDFLKEKEYVNKPMKLFLTESLLIGSNPRAHSFDSSMSNSSTSYDKTTNPFLHINRVNCSPDKSLDIESEENLKDKPILSLETNPLKTGVTTGSLTLGSPSLSPDNSSLESPTLIKFSKDDKLHYYREPLPKISPNSSSNSNENINIASVAGTDIDDDRRLGDNVNTSPSVNTPPKSPTITINPVFP